MLTFFNVSTFVLQVAYGAILVAAVSLSPLQERLARERQAMRIDPQQSLARHPTLGALAVAALLHAHRRRND